MGKKKRHRDEVELFFEPEIEEDLAELAPPPTNALAVVVDFMALVEFHDGDIKTAYEIVADLKDLLR